MSRKTSKGWTRINAEDFEALKHSVTLLMNSGLTNQATSIALKRSSATISMIKRSATYEDYRTLINKYKANYAASKPKPEAEPVEEPATEPEAAQDPVEVSSNDVALAIDELRLTLTIQMKEQTAAINRLADAWEAQPNKKGLFR